MLTTFLVNFANSSDRVDTAAASDFVFAEANVDLAATVHVIDNNEVATGLGTSQGGQFDVSVGDEISGGIFATIVGTYAAQPILDSYLVNRSETEFRTVTVSSLEEIAAGDTVTVTLFGVGDRTNQESEFRLIYDGNNLGSQTTDYDGTLQDTFVTYSFVKVAGVDELEIGFRNADTGGSNGALNGFSVVAGDPGPPPQQQAIRLNSGGNSHVDSNGNLFVPDDPFLFGGDRTSSSNQDVFIVGTGDNASNDADFDDVLYQANRLDNFFGYEIPVTNGLYDLNLHFAELNFNDPNERVFDVTVEGVTVLDNYDIFGTRENAFTPGRLASIVEQFQDIVVSDGALTIEFDSSASLGGTNLALVSAVEVLPVTDPDVVLSATDGETLIVEGGVGDSFNIVLSQAPTSDVTLQIAPGPDIAADITTLTFNASNFNVPRTIALTAVQDLDEEGQQTLQVGVTSSSADPNFDAISRSLDVTVIDDELAPIQFATETIANFNNPIAGTFGPDGRLYVADQFGLIRALTLDNDSNVIATEVITTLTDLPDPGNTLGITFNPFEEVAPGETPTLFVAQSFLFRDSDDFLGNVVALSGPNHSVVTEVITGLPASGIDHGINGLQFDGEGNLLIAVGGNTNTGFISSFGAQLPESPLTAAILRARISDPNFNGNIQYEFIDPTDPELIDLAQDLGLLGNNANTAASVNPNNQQLGDFLQVLDVAGEVEVEVFASGLRNPFDLVFTTQGTVFATDNGPNGIASDELNLITEDGFFGFPNIARGTLDPRQTLDNAEFDPNAPSTADLTSPLTAITSSTDGIDEFRSEVFDGQLQGQLIAQRFNNEVFFFELDDAGTDLENINIFNDGQIADGLDILTGPGGVIFGIDRNQDRITIARPVDDSVVTSTAFDIFPFRAPAVGGNQFTIGGANFGSLNDTTVLISGFEAELISVESNRIVGVFPAVPASTVLRDVTVISDQEVSILEGSFLPLGEGLETGVVGRNVFYNDSFFDGNDTSANAADDNAIATDKVALLPGETATFENYTSFEEGINGIIIDAHLADPTAFSAADIALATGVGSQFSDFSALNVSVDVSVRVGAGVDGSDRITIILPNGSVVNEFLQVSVLANQATGLQSDDVFYFGNVVGDSGDRATDTRVDAGDLGGVQANLTAFATIDVENNYDFDRDGRVDSSDLGIIQSNLTAFVSVPFITAPTLTTATSPVTVSAPATVTAPVSDTVPLVATASDNSVVTAEPTAAAVEDSVSSQSNLVALVNSSGIASAELSASSEGASDYSIPDELQLFGSEFVGPQLESSDLSSNDASSTDSETSLQSLDEFFESDFDTDVLVSI